MTAPARRAWFLNLDAERELAEPAGYTTPKALVEQMRERAAMTEALCAGEPIVALDATAAPEGVGPETLVIPWCPTPSALRRIQRLGLRAAASPPLEVLQRVNHRRFQHEVAMTVPGFVESRFATETGFIEPSGDIDGQIGELVARLARGPSVGVGWHLERVYGFAGKGARRISRAPDADDARWLEDSLRCGGILLEPWVAIERELSIHGWVDAEVILVGTPCELVCDRFGAPAGVNTLGGNAFSDFRAVLSDTAERVATALRGQGYSGPFGIDAIIWRSGEGVELVPISDVNARFTLGWSTGMGEGRERALARLRVG